MEKNGRARERGMPAKMLPQTPCVAGDRPALMDKVTNLSLRQEERRLSRRKIQKRT